MGRKSHGEQPSRRTGESVFDLPGQRSVSILVQQHHGFSGGRHVQTFNANTRYPYVQQWNLGIQKQLGKDWLARLLTSAK